MRKSARFVCLAALVVSGLALAGCAPEANDAQSSMYDRQQQAIKRPFDYTPGQDMPDISGGGIDNLDRKAIGKDLNDVFNP